MIDIRKIIQKDPFGFIALDDRNIVSHVYFKNPHLENVLADDTHQ
jgi:hypothetical protein